MIQDIDPSRLDNVYTPQNPCAEDNVLLFDGDGRLLVRIQGGGIRFTTGRDIQDGSAVYLFSVDAVRYFCILEPAEVPLPGFEFRTVRELRDAGSGKELYAAFTAYHLWRWYADNRLCGRCGGPNDCHASERALQCRCCGHVVYPRINPAVIVGVIKGDSLLITRYRKGYSHNALIAGFTEIGETLEQTVQREVMEEAGVRVHNIRYYKSQPWGMAQDLLVGFYCDADRGSGIRMDQAEMKYADWIRREEIVLQPNNLSLTNEMMRMFKEGKI